MNNVHFAIYLSIYTFMTIHLGDISRTSAFSIYSGRTSHINSIRIKNLA